MRDTTHAPVPLTSWHATNLWCRSKLPRLSTASAFGVPDRRPVRVNKAGQALLESKLGVRTATAIALKELSAPSEGQAGRVLLDAFASVALSVVPRALACLRRTHLDVHVKLGQLDIDMINAQVLRGEIGLALAFDYNRAPGQVAG
jgi:hypothetical protein